MSGEASTYRIKENAWIARLAARKLNTRNMAIVFGRTIYLHNASREEFLNNNRWFKHELCHVRQYQQYGFIGFLVRYAWESIRNGYRNNRFEVEARAAENL
jgi:hypothetical protein